MTKKQFALVLFMFFSLTADIWGREIVHTFLSPIYDGGHKLPIAACADVDGDQKPELIIGSQYGDCVTIIDDNLQQFVAPVPFTYIKGYIGIVAAADLNHNGVEEIIIGHERVLQPGEEPSLFILEKRNDEYQVIWESSYLGEISRFFVQGDKVIVYVDHQAKNIQRLHLLEYQGNAYRISQSIDIEGRPVYLGPLGESKNSLVICSETTMRGRLYKFGSHVTNISLKNSTLIDFSTGSFKPQQQNLILPAKDIWDLECYDLNQDGQDELILGAYDDDISIVEIYQWTPKGYDLVFTAKTPSKCYSPKGLILIDHDGNQIKEVLTVDGIMVHYNKDHFVATNFFSQLHIDSLITKANILACDLNQDNIDEIVLFVARDTEDFQLYNTYEAYYLTTPAQ